MKKNFRIALLSGAALISVPVATASSVSAEPVTIITGLVLGGKALLAWSAKAAAAKAAAATAAKIAARSAATRVGSTRVATAVAGTAGRAAASQAARMAITGAMKQTFQTQAASFAMRQSAVSVARDAAGKASWKYGNWIVGSLTAAQLLQGLGLGSANAEEVDEIVAQEIAVAGLHGETQYYLKFCEHDGQSYTVPNTWSSCGNGSEPKMLEQPIDPSKLRKQESGVN